jgi:hypothetical protein
MEATTASVVTVVDPPPAPPRGGRYLSDISPVKASWLSKGRLAEGKVHLLDGDPGIGKSTLLSDWTACITTGRPLPDGEARTPAGVVMLCEESLDDTVHPRVLAAGGDPTRVFVLEEKPYNGGGYLLPRDVEDIEREVLREQAALLIIDPWIAYLEPKFNPNLDHDVRQALRPLVEMAERTGVTVVLVRHLNKNVGASSMHRGTGSTGIAGAARIVLVLAKHPQHPDQLVLSRSKGNLGEPPRGLLLTLEQEPDHEVARVVYQGHTDLSADDLVMTEVRRGGRKLDQAKDWVHEVLADGSVPSTLLDEQAREAGISDATLRRAKKELGVVPRKDVGSRGPWLVSLPGDDAQEDVIVPEEDAQMDPIPMF